MPFTISMYVALVVWPIIVLDDVRCVGSVAYNSFRWGLIRLFNSLQMHLRSISSCSVLIIYNNNNNNNNIQYLYIAL